MIEANTPQGIAELSQLASAHEVIRLAVDFKKYDEPVIAALLNSAAWPTAVHPSMIVRTPEQKVARAKAIIEAVAPVAGKRVLDFGCGEGHCCEAGDRATVMVGYDIAANPTWESFKNCPAARFTTELAVVESHAPYDIILVCDVLDHLRPSPAGLSDPVAVLQKVGNMLGPNGFAYVRFHPWTARHGAHVYPKFNKAFAHFFLSEEELAKHDPDMPNKLFRPVRNYEKWIAQAGLQATKKNVIRNHDRLDFFQGVLGRHILRRWHNIPRLMADGGELPQNVTQLMEVISVEFVDYILTKKK